MFSFVLILGAVRVKFTASTGLGWLPWADFTGLYLWAGNRFLSAKGITISLKWASLSVFFSFETCGLFLWKTASIPSQKKDLLKL